MLRRIGGQHGLDGRPVGLGQEADLGLPVELFEAVDMVPVPAVLPAPEACDRLKLIDIIAPAPVIGVHGRLQALVGADRLQDLFVHSEEAQGQMLGPGVGDQLLRHPRRVRAVGIAEGRLFPDGLPDAEGLVPDAEAQVGPLVPHIQIAGGEIPAEGGVSPDIGQRLLKGRQRKSLKFQHSFLRCLRRGAPYFFYCTAILRHRQGRFHGKASCL